MRAEPATRPRASRLRAAIGTYFVGTLIAVSTLALGATGAAAQEDPEPPRTLRVFLDCQGPCDFDYIRREIPWVSWVRDRTDAHVHVIITTRGTGGGGRQMAIQLLGRGAFAGQEAELRETAAATAVPAEVREGLTRRLALGLVQFAAATEAGERLEVRVREDPVERAARPAPVVEDDPWNQWVFNLRGNVFLSGESRRYTRNFNGSFSAGRTTPGWKHSLFLRANLRTTGLTYFNEVSETQVDTIQVVDERYTYSSSVESVRSIAAHWSLGARASASAASRFNQDFTLSVGPALEYSLFPYEESDRRQLVVVYSPGVRYVDYTEITLFDKLHETLPGHQLHVAFEATQPWGGADIGASASQYLHDVTKYRVQVGGGMSVRLFRGLNLDAGGSFDWIRDQLFLPRAGETEEDVLLQRRQLATSYEYSLRFGLSYRFGSAFNNVVNPRLEGRGVFF